MNTKQHAINLTKFTKKYFPDLLGATLMLSIICGMITTIRFISNGECESLIDGIQLFILAESGWVIVCFAILLASTLSGAILYICHGILQDALVLIAGLSFLQFIYFLICILTVFLCHEVYKTGIYLSKGFLIGISVIAMINVVFMFHKNHRKNQ